MMPNKLKAITAAAKKLYKTGRYKKWTDAIKAASKQISGTGKHTDTKSHNVNIRVVSGVKKKAAKVNGWKKGNTQIIEKTEKKIPNKKNVRVYRNPKGGLLKPGTFYKFNTLGSFFDTSIISDIDALKKEYFKKAKIYHPDAGGTTAQFQQLQSEYEKLLKKLLAGGKLNAEQQENEILIDEALREVINQIIVLPGINIELVGKWLWVSGNTYPIKTELKKAGLIFIKKAGVPYWVYKGVESAGRGKLSIEEIKAKYGVQKFNPKENKFISGVRVNSKTKLLAALRKLTKGLNKRPV